MIIGVDFDGTIVKHKYPEIGDPVPGAIEKLKEFNEQGHKIILWTLRGGTNLNQAVDYLKENGIKLYGINKNPAQVHWSNSPKAHCNVYIDDAAYGCPILFTDNDPRPYVDWSRINLGTMECE